MTARQLAVTLTGLRRQIVSGECSPAEALGLPQTILSEHAPRWKCVTHIFPLGTPADASLPLAGVGLAHKDICAMQGRAPECGTARHLPLPRFSGTVVRRLEAAGSHAT